MMKSSDIIQVYLAENLLASPLNVFYWVAYELIKATKKLGDKILALNKTDI